MIKIADTVNNFYGECCKIIGHYEINKFRIEHDFKLTKYSVNSPIEQLFELSFDTLLHITASEEYPYISTTGDWVFSGIHVEQQKQIGNYKVDFFLAEHGEYDNDKQHYSPNKIVVVELDGHKFHDRDEKQRRYEKKRDRFLQSQGMHVFHFTGAEIVRDPFVAAIECYRFFYPGYEEKELRHLIEEYQRG